MKNFILMFLISLKLHAIELKFIGPCSENFIMKTQVRDEYLNVGELTVATLTKFGIPFTGSAEVLQSAFLTPTGSSAIEIVSSNEARYYGWCYSVDGVYPETYPHEVPITPDTKSIVWTFSYDHLLNGQWGAPCTPSHKIKPLFLCQD